jgi:hypothetical protein
LLHFWGITPNFAASFSRPLTCADFHLDPAQEPSFAPSASASASAHYSPPAVAADILFVVNNDNDAENNVVVPSSLSRKDESSGEMPKNLPPKTKSEGAVMPIPQPSSSQLCLIRHFQRDTLRKIIAILLIPSNVHYSIMHHHQQQHLHPCHFI